MAHPFSSPANPLRKTVLAGLIGNAIEFYDFIIYAYLASYFAKHFFPSDDPVAALIASYGAFATGMVMRPIGGIVLGGIGDRIGRKFALQVSVALVAIPTVIIGMMPTYDVIGVWAPILLIALRMIQGLAVGGEYSASIVYMIERALPQQRGLVGSFSPMGAFLGLLLGTIVSFVCIFSLGKEEMSEWGWRIPFLFSVVLTVIGIWFRRSMTEGHNLSKHHRHRSPIAQVLTTYRTQLLAIALANVSTGIVSFIGFMYMVPWVVKEAGITIELALGFNVLSLVLVGILTLWGGHLGDIYGRLRVARWGTCILILGAWPAFALAQSGSYFGLSSASLILALGQGLFVGPMCAAMATLLPAHVRATGIGLGYSFSVGIFGGLAPMLTEYLLSRQQLTMAPAIVVIAGACVSSATLYFNIIWQHSTENLPEDAIR